jgi:hypothetical protein
MNKYGTEKRKFFLKKKRGKEKKKSVPGVCGRRGYPAQHFFLLGYIRLERDIICVRLPHGWLLVSAAARATRRVRT